MPGKKSRSIKVKVSPNYSLFLINYSLFILFLTSLLSLSSSSSSAQSDYSDSLFAAWKNVELQDTSRLDALYDLAWNYRNDNPDSALSLSQIQMNYAKQYDHPFYIAGAHRINGIAYENLLDFSKSEENYLAALDGYKSLGDTVMQYRMNGSLGWLNWTNGTYDTAKHYFRNAIELAKFLGDKEKESTSMHGLAYSYFQQGQFATAMQIVEKSLKLSLEVDDVDGITWGYNAMGVFYSRQGNDEKALEYYLKSLKIRLQGSDSVSIAYSLRNVGSTYSDLGDHVKALEYLERSLEMGKDLQNDRNRALSLRAISSEYLENGDTSTAMERLKEALALARGIGNRKMIGETLARIGSIQVQQGLIKIGLENCQNSYEIAVEVGAVDDQLDACGCLFLGYKRLGNSNKALHFMELRYELKDSMDIRELTESLQQMEFSKQRELDSLFREEEKQKLILSHQLEVSEKEKSRNVFMAGGVILLLVAFGLLGRNRYMRKAKINIEKEKDRSEQLLLNILPAEIAEELKEKGEAEARDFESVSILFTDFKGFTEKSAKLSATVLVSEINHCFKAFDHIIEKYGIEKIKTIGDAYMAAGGLPVPGADSVKNTVLAALEMQDFIEARSQELRAKGQPHFQMRVGIHTGPVVAGIVGVKKFQYDVWGDTVNTASRIESAGEVGKVNISQATYELLTDPEPVEGSDEGSESRALSEVEGQLSTTSHFNFESRGKVEVKGKGEISMYFVLRNS